MAGNTRERLTRLGGAYRRGLQAFEDDRAALQAAMWEADGAGWSLAQIATAAGLGRSTVHRLLVKETARRQVVTVDALEDRR